MSLIQKVEQFYNETYCTIPDDVNEFKSQCIQFFTLCNPPPDMLVKVRATAFKIACQYLHQIDSDRLLQTIQTIVTCIEDCCYSKKSQYTNHNDEPTDEETYTNFYNSIFDGTALDSNENEQLISFLRQQGSIVMARTMAFTVGQQYMSDSSQDKEQILRCINVIIHAIETVFYQPKSYHLSSSSSSSSYASASMATNIGSARLEEPSHRDDHQPTNSTTDFSNLDSMNLNEAAQQLWNYDSNRLVMNDDIYLNVQTGKKPYNKDDTAHEPLFTKVEGEVLQRPTYASFIHLLDNYTSLTGTADDVSTIERKEIDHFIDTIMETAPMQFCYQYCKAHNQLQSNEDSIQEFKDLLYTIWFEPYSRDGKKDSSGFEHVFVGEIQDNEISGFHNWIQFYQQERLGHVDYRGYIKPRGHNETEHDSDDHVLTLQFKWISSMNSNLQVEKFVGTMFIGVSPEFEMALYTMCFLFGQEENSITLDTGSDVFELVIKCYTIANGKIGTTFPEVTSHYNDE